MSEIEVLNKHSVRGKSALADGSGVYIGRPSKWGNPFVIGRDGSRLEVIFKYMDWIEEPEQAHLRADLHELRGKKLVCFCDPYPCHGDVLKELAERLPV